MKNVWILSKKDSTDYENSRLIQEFQNQNIDVRLVHPDSFDIVALNLK